MIKECSKKFFTWPWPWPWQCQGPWSMSHDHDHDHDNVKDHDPWAMNHEPWPWQWPWQGPWTMNHAPWPWQEPWTMIMTMTLYGMQVVLASAFIPVFSGWLPPRYRGIRVIGRKNIYSTAKYSYSFFICYFIRLKMFFFLRKCTILCKFLKTS